MCVCSFTANNLWCSLIRVNIVASVPGGHCGRDMLKWGHMKLRKVDTKLTDMLFFIPFISYYLNMAPLHPWWVLAGL